MSRRNRSRAIAKAAGIAILYGYPERTEDGQIYNAVQLIDATRRAPVQLPQDAPVRRSRPFMFSPGADDFPVVELNGWKLGFPICYDLEFPENAGAWPSTVPN